MTTDEANLKEHKRKLRQQCAAASNAADENRMAMLVDAAMKDPRTIDYMNQINASLRRQAQGGDPELSENAAILSIARTHLVNDVIQAVEKRLAAPLN